MGKIASTLAELGSGSAAGDIGAIRVSQGGESYLLQLYWDDIASKWISDTIDPIITSDDGDWTGVFTSNGDWQYWGSANSELGKWNLRSAGIPFAGALFAAGLKLQDRASARMSSGAGASMMVTPWFYEYNENDPLIFSNDQSAQASKTWNGHADLGFEPSPENIGHGVVLQYDGSGASRIHSTGQYDDGIVSSPYHALVRNAGWDYIKFFVASQLSGSALGGVPTNVPYTPTKKYLYPTLYGRMWNGAGIASYSWECRWVS